MLISIILIIQVRSLLLLYRIYDDLFNVLEFMKILVDVRVIIIMEIVDIVSSLEGLDQILIVIEVLLFLRLRAVARLFVAALAVRLVVLLVVRELVLVLFARMVVAIVVIVTTELIKALLVKKVTIRVVET